MHHVIAHVLLAGGISSGVIAPHGQTGGAAAGSRVAACSLMPRTLMEKVTPGPVNKIVFDLKPHEEALGAGGSSCDYATTTLQVDPFPRAEEMRRNSPGKDWVRLPGVGDTAYFHNNLDRYAELIVWTGAHHFTLQMFVPMGKTVEAIKPNAIMLANAIIPKLR
jgi:hypothetical protein